MVPDNVQNGTRVAMCVLVACAVGYGVVLPWRGRPHKGDAVIQYAQACKWAAITSVVIAQPVIGKLSQVGVERILGTILGGLFGFAAYRVGLLIWDDMYTRWMDGLVLSLLAALAAFTGTWGGAKLKLDYSAKLFTLTFLLVTFGAVKDDKAALVMVTRICGICGGVLLSLLASVVIFPRSASQESIREMGKALSALSEISSLVWSEGIHHSLQEGATSNGTAAGGTAPPPIPCTPASLATGLTGGHSADGSGANANEELCEDKLTAMYNALTKSMDFAGQSKGEIYVGSLAGSPYFLPGLPWWPMGRWQLPAHDFTELGASMKAVARILFALHLAFDEGFDDDLIALVGQQYPAELFPHLGANAHGSVSDAAQAFPSHCVPPRNLMRYHQAVEGLLAISDYRRRQIYQRLRPEKRPLRAHSMRPRRRNAATSSGAAPSTAGAVRNSSLAYSISGKCRLTEKAAVSACSDSPNQGSHYDSRTRSAALPYLNEKVSGSVASSGETLSDIQQHHASRSPFEAFSGLPDDLRIDVWTPSSSPLREGSAMAGTSQPSLMVQQGAGNGGEQLKLTLPKFPSSELLVFPDTAGGYVNSVRWASFQFLIAELAEEMQELHRVLAELIERMPHPNPFS